MRDTNHAEAEDGVHARDSHVMYYPHPVPVPARAPEPAPTATPHSKHIVHQQCIHQPLMQPCIHQPPMLTGRGGGDAWPTPQRTHHTRQPLYAGTCRSCIRITQPRKYPALLQHGMFAQHARCTHWTPPHRRSCTSRQLVRHDCTPLLPRGCTPRQPVRHG